jgi:hypothetical protein
MRPHTGFSPSAMSCSKELRPPPTPKHPLQITTRTLKEPDFKFELLPLHSPLLGQSLLVSFPPLIDMLKFSGYPYLIRGQAVKVTCWTPIRRASSCKCAAQGAGKTAANVFEASPRAKAGQAPITKHSLRLTMTLEQACPTEYRGAQCAFKDSMIH